MDEYPVEALREALVNAVAHRQYEDAGRKIMLEVFSDRVAISSRSGRSTSYVLAVKA
jgi:ATP-dependent DNA helicase RecG